MVKIINKDLQIIGSSNTFNEHGLGEVIVYYNDGSMDSEYIRNLNVILESGENMNMSEAFRLKRLIPNNYNTYFGEPRTELEYNRGWY